MVNEIPKGFCQCGCGEKTLLAKETSTRRGYRKGEPMNYIYGHNMRGRKNKGTAIKGCLNHSWKGGKSKDSRRHGQSFIYCPGHPRAHKRMVSEHVLIVEKALGKYLPPKAIVHHHTIEQLVACENQAYHLFIHQRTRAYKACGNANWRKCTVCKIYDAPDKVIVSKQGQVYHRECINLRHKDYQKRKKEGTND